MGEAFSTKGVPGIIIILSSSSFSSITTNYHLRVWGVELFGFGFLGFRGLVGLGHYP